MHGEIAVKLQASREAEAAARKAAAAAEKSEAAKVLELQEMQGRIAVTERQRDAQRLKATEDANGSSRHRCFCRVDGLLALCGLCTTCNPNGRGAIAVRGHDDGATPETIPQLPPTPLLNGNGASTNADDGSENERYTVQRRSPSSNSPTPRSMLVLLRDDEEVDAAAEEADAKAGALAAVSSAATGEPPVDAHETSPPHSLSSGDAVFSPLHGSPETAVPSPPPLMPSPEEGECGRRQPTPKPTPTTDDDPTSPPTSQPERPSPLLELSPPSTSGSRSSPLPHRPQLLTPASPLTTPGTAVTPPAAVPSDIGDARNAAAVTSGADDGATAPGSQNATTVAIDGPSPQQTPAPTPEQRREPHMAANGAAPPREQPSREAKTNHSLPWLPSRPRSAANDGQEHTAPAAPATERPPPTPGAPRRGHSLQRATPARPPHAVGRRGSIASATAMTAQRSALVGPHGHYRLSPICSVTSAPSPTHDAPAGNSGGAGNA